MAEIDQADLILQAIEKEQRGEIVADSFWDQAGSDVRSSNDAHPDVYTDPSSHSREWNGTPVASLLPSRGPRGIVIPRATRFGRSRGWDPHKPIMVNIDPDVPGGASVVDMSKLTPEAVDAAVAETSNLPNYKLAASVAFRKLAVGTEPIGMPVADSIQHTAPQQPAHPLGLAGAYVAPRMERGVQKNVQVNNARPAAAFGQAKLATVNQQPVIQKDGVDPLAEKEAEALEAKLFEQAVLQRRPEPVAQPPRNLANMFNQAAVNKPPAINNHPAIPSENVTYEVEGFGHLTSPYHRVIRDGIVLVLVYDNNFTAGQKFFPANSDKSLIVDVHNHPSVYKVMVPGIKFTLDNYDICVLLIADERDKKG